jgi:hypothetical protein
MFCSWPTLPRASRQIEAPPGHLPLPLINLVPHRLLSLLHSLKLPVLNFHCRRSVTSSDPSPHRLDAIKGARSQGHFTHSISPHLAPLICAPSRLTPSTKAMFHSPFDVGLIPPMSRQLPPLERFPIVLSLFSAARGEVFPTRVAARLDSSEPFDHHHP